MRRIGILAAATALLASGCMFPQGWHWPRTVPAGSPTTTETVVYWAARYGLVSYHLPIVQWAASYYNAHPELRIVIVDRCPTGKSCVLWRTGNLNGALTWVSIGGSKHLVASTVTLDDGIGRDVSLSVSRMYAFHEGCHSFGGGFTPPGGVDIHSLCNWEHRAAVFTEVGRVYHDDPG